MYVCVCVSVYCCCCSANKSCPTFCDPMSRPWNSPGQNTGVGSLSLLQGIFPTQGSNPGLLHCRWFLTSESQGKPQNTGVGSLPLLQQIFLTQELKQDLLPCRWILYHLRYQGSPCVCVCVYMHTYIHTYIHIYIYRESCYCSCK